MLFVCIGNTCRSPMAEAFANQYGSDVLVAESRGLAPTDAVSSDTIAIMHEKNIDVSRHIPRRYDPLDAEGFDIVVNMSGFNLPGPAENDIRNWTVEDPYGRSPAVYKRSCDDIENRVMRLILELRKKAK